MLHALMTLDRIGLLSREQALIETLYWYAHTVKTILVRLTEAESMRPRIYCLGQGGGPDVRPASR
jgi:hypothetical protein